MKKDRTYYQKLSDKIQQNHPFLNFTELSYEIILHEILNGNILQEDLIQQEALSVLLGMSRTPVRDALLKLECEGYLTRNEKGSFRLFRGSISDYMDFSEFRLMIEPKAAALAARKISKSQISDLKQNLETLKGLISDGELHQIMEVDYQFHVMIAKASGNRYLQDVLQNYKVKMTFNFRYVLKPQSLELLYKVHSGIVQAIIEREDDLAERRMYKHLQFYMDNLRDVFERDTFG